MRRIIKTTVIGVLALGACAVLGMSAFASEASPVIESGRGQMEATENQTVSAVIRVESPGGTGGTKPLTGPGPAYMPETAGQQRDQEEQKMTANGLGIKLEDLDAAKDPAVDQFLVVVGSGMDSSHVKVGYYVRGTAEGETAWTEQFAVDGYCGHNGMAAEKREGDRRTPTGTYSFTQAFGSLDDPGSILPYKKLDEYDYWVDDSSSAYYNQMVNTKTVKKDWSSAEHLIGVMPQYRYSLALNYNTEERTPGKGSAIFLHGYHTWKTWTEGCIAIPEENMKLLVQQLDGEAKIVIMPQIPEAVTE